MKSKDSDFPVNPADGGAWNGPSRRTQVVRPDMEPRHLRHPEPPHHRRTGRRLPSHGHGGLQAEEGDAIDFAARVEETLVKVLPEAVVDWLLQIIGYYGPAEIVAVFKAQIATIQTKLAQIESRGEELPYFLPEELQESQETVSALSQSMSDMDARGCLRNLFVGPEEIQVIAFLALLILRLNADGVAEFGKAGDA